MISDSDTADDVQWMSQGAVLLFPGDTSGQGLADVLQ